MMRRLSHRRAIVLARVLLGVVAALVGVGPALVGVVVVGMVGPAIISPALAQDGGELSLEGKSVRRSAERPQIADVELGGVLRVDAAAVRKQIRTKPGDRVDGPLIAADV